MTATLRIKPVEASAPRPGERTKEGLIYCGISPHTSLPFYIMPQDEPRPVTWQAAQIRAQKSFYYGKDDWRVPTQSEWALIFKLRHRLGLSFDTANPYWASAPHYLQSGWIMAFNEGLPNRHKRVGKKEFYNVRFVRGPDPYTQR